MADGLFTLAVVTPEERLVETTARAAVLRSSDGDLTVLDGHTPLITDVVSGEVRVEADEGAEVRLAVHGGFLQVETGTGVAAGDGGPGDGGPGDGGPGDGERGTRVTVLAGVAERAEQIDVPRAERARDEATARVDELRAATGRTGATAEAEEAPSTPEEVELAQAEAALRRAELRLEVAAGA
ncbi:MAG: F0F1 ATP synthase subunit epsilon [Acidimicrobiales bacterium]